MTETDDRYREAGLRPPQSTARPLAVPDSFEDVGPYDGVNVPALKAAIARRNEGRDEDTLIVPAKPGNRAELVAALIADDNATPSTPADAAGDAPTNPTPEVTA